MANDSMSACADSYQSGGSSGSNSTPFVTERKTTAKAISIELCCGSANFSFHMKFYDCIVLPVDWTRNKHKTKLPYVRIDLADEAQIKVLDDLIASGNVKSILAAVPCGTASRAREIPLPDGRPGPRPLRSSEYPLGLPDLEKDEQARVDKANSIYSNVLKLILHAHSCGVICIIENPRGSYLWDIEGYSQLLQMGFVDVDFQHCKFSPECPEMRPKWTRLRTNCKALLKLSGQCTLTHKHLSWGVLPSGQFATEGEAEYNDGMCKAVTEVLASELELNEVPLDPDISNATPHKRRRAAIGKQPRGKQLPNLLPEYLEVKKMSLLQGSADGHKIIRVLNPDLTADSGVEPQVIAGKFRDPKQYMEMALEKAKHPVDIQGSIPDELVNLVFNTLSNSRIDASRKQIDAVKMLTKLAKDHEKLDAEVICGMNERHRHVMRNKKLATLRALAIMSNYHDVAILDEIAEGIKLTGMKPYTGAFDQQLLLPETVPEVLRTTSSVNNEAMMARCRSSGDKQTDRTLWEQALDEAKPDKKWLSGPFYDLQQLRDDIGSEPHLSRRFPLKQKQGPCH